MLRSAQQLSLDQRAFHQCPQDKGTVRGLLEAAQRKTQDALLAENSLDTRVEANYDACFNIALAVLNAQGWKSKSIEGHHRFALEAACSAIGASDGLYERVDAIRDVRNLKYTGASRTKRDLDFSKKVQEEFSGLAVEWLQATHLPLLQP
jgi:hypothetical protein